MFSTQFRQIIAGVYVKIHVSLMLFFLLSLAVTQRQKCGICSYYFQFWICLSSMVSLCAISHCTKDRANLHVFDRDYPVTNKPNSFILLRLLLMYFVPKRFPRIFSIATHVFYYIFIFVQLQSTTETCISIICLLATKNR